MASALYEIAVRGPVGAGVVAALEGFEVVATDAGGTTLRGRVVDQAGLHGVLNRISGFGLELTRVAPVARHPDGEGVDFDPPEDGPS
ncbi:MAG: hypothetical protein K0R11_1902 [Acidimicrobiales bacterium]|nr:hypothetical protein [Acidimicrobiales bacterium]